MGTPSTTNNGELLRVNETRPRITIFDEAPGVPDELVISTPATLELRAFTRFASLTAVTSSPLTSCAA